MSTRDDKGEGRAFIEHPAANKENSRSPFDFTQGRLSTSLLRISCGTGGFGKVHTPFFTERRTRGLVVVQCGRKSGYASVGMTISFSREYLSVST